MYKKDQKSVLGKKISNWSSFKGLNYASTLETWEHRGITIDDDGTMRLKDW